MLLQKLRQLFRRINNESGFTLAEFFVAIIIFSIIALSLFHALNLTLRVYKQEAYLVDNTPDITMISTIIHREIQNAVYMNDIWLIGGAREMYFFAPTSLTESDIPVSRITYCILENDRNGFYIQRKTQNPFSEKEEEDDVSKFVYEMDGPVSDIMFNYASLAPKEEEGEDEEKQEIEWKNAWNEPFFPDAFKIVYYFSDAEEPSSHEAIITLPWAWNRKIEEEE